MLSARHKSEENSHRDDIGWSKDSAPTSELGPTKGARMRESDDGAPGKAEPRASAAHKEARAHRAKTCGNSKPREEPICRTLSMLNAALRVWEAKNRHLLARSVWRRRSQA